MTPANAFEVVQSLLLGNAELHPLMYLTSCFKRALREASSRMCKTHKPCAQAVSDAKRVIATVMSTALLEPALFPGSTCVHVSAGQLNGASAHTHLRRASGDGSTQFLEKFCSTTEFAIHRDLMIMTGKEMAAAPSEAQAFVTSLAGHCIVKVNPPPPPCPLPAIAEETSAIVLSIGPDLCGSPSDCVCSCGQR